MILNLPNFAIEESYSGIIAGIDEAGRGPLCGNVVASCVVLDREKYPKDLNDSKKLSEKKREKIFEELMQLSKENLFFYGSGQASPREIDEVNILNATKLAMQRAYLELKRIIQPNLVLVDGNFIPEIDTKAEFVIKGDSKSLSIAAASIIAKVTRDRQMLELAKQYPEYDWEKNKGYPTKNHVEKIKKFGISELYRKSFLKKIV